MTKERLEAAAKAETPDGRLHALEGHAIKTEGRLDRIDDTLRAHGAQMGQLDGKLDQLITAVTHEQAAKRPPFDIHAWVRTVGSLAGACAVLAGLATWFVIKMTAVDLTTLTLAQKSADEKLQIQLAHIREVADLRYQIVSEKLSAWKWTPTLETRTP